jgi:catechol 2,3-dioxygenase-like lactoylglutathione lyase family enzyme
MSWRAEVAFDQFVTFLSTADLEKATAFYRDRLELELALDQGRCRIFRVSGDGFLGVCEGVPSPDGVIVTLVATDVEAKCRRLEEAGVVFERPLAHHPELDITHAFLRDPDGHLVEIQRFDDPAWASKI